MGEIETMMRKSVRAITEEGIQQYKTTKRGDFVLGHAAMVVLAVTQHYWTIEEAALRELKEEAGIDALDMTARGVLQFIFDDKGKLKRVAEACPG